MPAKADTSQIHVFPVRHLSPSGAWHLRRFLDRVRPERVLIEGLSDAGPLIADITRKRTVPPVAILAYTETAPVETLVYPLARYSPEYQALAWAKSNRVEAEFIDLPSDIFLALRDRDEESVEEDGSPSQADEEADDATESEPELDGGGGERIHLYDRMARAAGESDYDTYWERNFEHSRVDETYRLGAYELGLGLRELDEATPESRAEDIVREAFMRRRIEEVIAEGVDPQKTVAVVGAFHASVLTREIAPLSDEELAKLPRRASRLTLMPYSYFKLSSQSGYGAGNRAPAYFQLVWEAFEKDDLDDLPARYLASVARQTREHGTHRSAAEVIEGVRLSRTLAGLRGGHAPSLTDLRDAATTLIGYGETSAVSDALARVEVGTEIGSLPKGISQTSIQDDFERELEKLKLVKFRSAVKQELRLDLRENRRAKTEAAAYLDLHRSSFFHRLRILEIDFAKRQRGSASESTTWAEEWHLQWSPESEIQLVESILLGETVELAAAFKFRARLATCKEVDEAARLVRDACECALLSTAEQARRRLQELCTESSGFGAAARACQAISGIVRYGDVRQFDSGPLLPLLDELFVQGALSLVVSANCDNEAAKSLAEAMDLLDRVGLDFHERVDEELWVSSLSELASRDDRNPILSGHACSILLERDLMTNDELSREVSRRLSPGIDADLSASWFEGLARRNRYALLARQSLWEQLADYVKSLDEEEFRRALVFLRRAFGAFSPSESRAVAENLGEHWNLGRELASEMIDAPLSEDEEEALDELNDLDFDDL
ncbi:MAG: DUF5682 family protein [Planctomycetota bacterium]